MPGRGLLIAAVVLAALAGGVWYSNKLEKDKEGKPPDDAAPKLIDTAQDQIIRVEIAKKGSAPVVLERVKDDTWNLQAPKPAGADSDAVSSMVSTLASFSSERLIDEKVGELGEFGLDSPELTVTVGLKDGKTQKVLIGDEAPTGGGFFAKLEGDPRLFSIYSYNRSSLDKSWDDLRDKRLMTFDPGQVSRVELTAKGGTVELGKTGQGEWQVLKPDVYRADNVIADEVVRKLQGAKMEQVAADEAQKAAALYRAGRPVATAKVTSSSGTQQIEIRKNQDDFYARSNVVEGFYKIGRDIEGVDKTLDDLRNKKLFDFGFNDPTKIEIRDGDETTTLTKSGEDWQRDGKKMESTGVQQLIDRLRELVAARFLKAGPANPTVEITIVSDGGKRTEKVELSKSGAAFAGKRSGEPALYEVGSVAVEEIQQLTRDLKEASTAPPAKK